MNALEWYISKFPEALYPCSAENQYDYAKKVILGRQKMSESNRSNMWDSERYI